MMTRAAREGVTVSEQLIAHPLFDRVDTETLRTVIAESHTRQFSPGMLLAAEGETAIRGMLVVQGSVRQITTAGEFEPLTTMIFHAPAAVGVVECLLTQPYIGNLEAVEKTTVLEIPAATVLAAVNHSPAFCANLLRDTASVLHASVQREQALAFCPVHVRLARALSSLIEAYGLPTPGGMRIRVPISGEQLASMLGVNRRSVHRALRWWVEEGVLSRVGRHLLVRDVARLQSDGQGSLVHRSRSSRDAGGKRTPLVSVSGR